MERKRVIVISSEESRYIQRAFNVSQVTVWQAVKYVKNNDLHRRIRKFAIERGNPQMVLSPEFETIHLTNREESTGRIVGYMVQEFENGATMEGNRETGHVEVRNKRGEIKGEWENPHISELKAIEEMAMSL